MSSTPSPAEYLFDRAALERMRAAEELFDVGTERLAAAIPFDRGGVALEVGAGAGSVARWLSREMAPAGRVVASDIDVTPLTEKGPLACEVRRHDVVVDPLEESRFAFIHARLLLEHLPQRARVLDKLVRALRPGGWLMIEDVDYAGAEPVSELGAEVHARVQEVRLREFASSGVDHFYGRALPELLRRAGLEEVAHDGRTQLIEGGSPSARWLRLSLAHLRPRLVATGEVQDGDIDSMLTLLDNRGFVALGPVMFAAWGRRADETNG